MNGVIFDGETDKRSGTALQPGRISNGDRPLYAGGKPWASKGTGG